MLYILSWKGDNKMKKYIIKTEGMACSMCEAHMNEMIRNNFPSAKKIASSHQKGETTFITDETVEEEIIKNKVADMGYSFISLESKPYEKKGLFGR